MKLTNEPTMDTIDDYHNQESKEKRKSIRMIILGLIVFGGLLSYIRVTNNTVSDYIGTPENPGIQTLHHH